MADLRGEVLLDVLPDGVKLRVEVVCIVVCSLFLFECIGARFVLWSGFSVLVEALHSSYHSRAHLAFLRCFVPFAQNINCRCVLGMFVDAARTKYVNSTISTNAASG